MKVLLVIDSLGAGGAQNQITLLAVGLQKEGYDVTVFSYHKMEFFKPRLDSNDIKNICVEKRNKVGFRMVRILTRLISKNQYDVVLSYMDIPNFYAALALKLSSSKATKLIISYRSSTSFESLNFINLKLREWTNKNADGIICNSHHERENWKSKYPKLKLKTIYNGIISKHTSLTSFKNNNVLTAIGSFSHHKNGIVILEAMKILKEKGKLNFKLNWVGRRDPGIKNNDDYIVDFDQKLIKYGLKEYWNWCGQSSDISKYYFSSDALIHASKKEGMPNVVGEAQIHSLPVIISNVLDHPIIIKEGMTGFLFNPEDPYSLADTIETFYTLDTQDRIEMKIKSLENGENLFSYKGFINSTISLIQETE